MSTDTITKNEIKSKVKKIPLYKVIFHNDDYTPMGFVVLILIKIFGKSQDEAEKIMLEVHNNGKSVVAKYNREIALTKQHLVEQNAKMHQHPLLCTIEPDSEE